MTHAPSSGAAPPQSPQGTLTHAPSSGSADPEPDPGTASSEEGLNWLAGGHASGALTHGLQAASSRNTSPGDSSRWEVGQVLAGIYRVDSLLGEGGMGAVYRVRHTEWGVDLAVKTPLPRLFADPIALQRFQREAETWIDLGLHPNVARCYYVREVEGSPRIFVEFVQGGTLKEWLQNERDPADWSTILRLALEAADGLAFAHSRGLVHRDVKPANCLLSKRGALRITDFGLVKVTGEADLAASGGNPSAAAPPDTPELTRVEAGMGTPEYAAPEQWESASEVDARADLYSWGVLVWELVTGRRPFDAPDERQPAAVLINRHCFSELPNIRDHRLDVPTRLIALLKRCLAKSPDERPASISEARASLAEIYTERCREPAPPVPPTPRVTAAVLCNRALSLRDLGQHAAAQATWEEAIRLEPHHPESRFNLGLLAWRAGKIRDLEVVEQLEAVRAVHTRAWIDELLLAQVHVERGDGDAALALLDEIPPAAQTRPRVVATRAAAEERANSIQPVGAPLPSFAAHTGELVGWNQRYLLFLFDPVNRMGARPGLTVFGRDGKRHAQLDLQGEERLGRTALAGPRASALQGAFACAACLSGRLKVWDLRQGSAPPRYVLRGPGPMDLLAVEGARALTGALVGKGLESTGEATAWDLTRGRRLASCKHTSPITALAISGDEAWSADATSLKVWALSDGALRASWDLEGISGIHPCAGGAILEFPDGAWRWDRAGEARGRRFSRRASARLVRGRILAEVCSDGVRLWDLERETCGRTVAHPAAREEAALRAALELNPPGHELRSRAPASDPSESATDPKPSLDPSRRPPASLVLVAGPGEPLTIVHLRHFSLPWQAPLALARVESSEAALALQKAFRSHLGAAQSAVKTRQPARALRALGMARAVEGFARHPEALAVMADLSRECRRSGLATVWEGLSLKGDWRQTPQLAFSPTGEFLALAADGRTEVYRVSDGTRVRVLEHEGEPQFLPGGGLRLGRALFGPEEDAPLRVLEPVPDHPSLSPELQSTGLPPAAPVARLFHDAAGRMAWSPLGNAIWSLEDGALLRVSEPLRDQRPRGALQPGGRIVVNQVGPREIAVVDLAREELIDTLPCGSAFRIEALALDEVGRYLAVAGINADEPRVQVWDLRERSLLVNQPWPATILDLCFLPANDLLVVSDARGDLTLWDHILGEVVSDLPRQDPPAEHVRASGDGFHLVTAQREAVKLIYLDWTLSERSSDTWPPEADDLLVDFCARLRPGGLSPKSTAPPAVAAWIEGAGRPIWRPQDLDELTWRLSRAGFGGISRERLRAALERVRDHGPRRATQARTMRLETLGPRRLKLETGSRLGNTTGRVSGRGPTSGTGRVSDEERAPGSKRSEDPRAHDKRVPRRPSGKGQSWYSSSKPAEKSSADGKPAKPPPSGLLRRDPPPEESEGGGDSPSALLGRLLDESAAAVNYEERSAAPVPILIACGVATLAVGIASSVTVGLTLGFVTFGLAFLLHHGRCEQAANEAVADFGAGLGQAVGEALPEDLEAWVKTYPDLLLRRSLQRSLTPLSRCLRVFR